MRILITGASGMLGATLVDNFSNKYNIFATSRSNFSNNKAHKFMEFDLLNDSYKNLISWSKPEIIIHCAAITNLDYCEQNEQIAREVNTESLAKIMEYSKNARIIFISSDAVFQDGLKLPNENSVTIPQNVYGKSKLQGEKILLNSAHPHLALRTTIVGRNINYHSKYSFLEWLIESLKNKEEITLFKDAIFNPITIWDFSNELDWIINNKIEGVFHLSGREIISKYDFGMKICNALGFDLSLIKVGYLDEQLFKAKRNKDQTLDSSRYQVYSNRKLPTINQTIKYITKYFKESYYE